MQTTKNGKLERALDWRRMDIEQRLGFQGGKYTDVNTWLSLLLGLALAAFMYLFVRYAGCLIPGFGSVIAPVFLERGPTQYFVIWFVGWSLAIMFLKWRKLAFQEQALQLQVTPPVADFTLAPATAKPLLERIYTLVDNPKHFVLLNRIERALENMHNIGMIADVSEMLRAQAQNDEERMESSYALVRAFIWGIPVLGFIGTVLGLSSAIGNFGGALRGEDTLNALKENLQGVTSGLATAFDTTLVALVAALIIQYVLTALKKKEEAFLDDCKDFCHANVVGKLRLIAGEVEGTRAKDGART